MLIGITLGAGGTEEIRTRIVPGPLALGAGEDEDEEARTVSISRLSLCPEEEAAAAVARREMGVAVYFGNGSGLSPPEYME
jgi:hypothetical protein